MIMRCKACKSDLGDCSPGNYYVCPRCGSATLVSDNESASENKKYFDEVYAGARAIDAQRAEWFNSVSRWYGYFHRSEVDAFCLFLKKIENLICASGKVVEIGFGTGDEMLRFLEAGAEIYGLELSGEAVRNFQLSYPHYAHRVSQGIRLDFPVNLVYSNALFEHLDNPDEFLDNAASMLPCDGALIIRLPLITSRITAASEAVHDINFWKPCHRALYTHQGIGILLREHGFSVMETACLKYFGYRVMNIMLASGYEEIQNVRSPFGNVKGLTSDLRYRLMLLAGLFKKTVCADCAIIAQKV